eukprot:XP_001709596.1 Hypothetical protein GL50803_38155 [Giardia lamblia ATCC 50803]
MKMIKKKCERYMLATFACPCARARDTNVDVAVANAYGAYVFSMSSSGWYTE